jgi:hypothetical protein
MLCGMMRRSVFMRACSATPSFSALRLTVLGCAVLLLIAGCGQIGSSGASSSNPSPSSRSAAGAYLSCLHKHGVIIPTASGTGESGGLAIDSSTFEKAQETCVSTLPGIKFTVAFQAFRSCMSSHGERVPSTLPTASPTSGTSSADPFFLGLNLGNPKVAAALKACQSKLPSSFTTGTAGLVPTARLSEELMPEWVLRGRQLGHSGCRCSLA